ncbi:MAG: hypothetical protein IJE25_07385 [Clostridia bacterium]|nr:hypothetical protein [Clostridia bacterium]
MNTEIMRAFLSEETIKTHLEYVRQTRLKYSIYEKSIPEIKGAPLRKIYGSKFSEQIKKEILPYIISIKSHELYFSSFCERPRPCPEIKEYYSSAAAFLYEVREAALDIDHGFLYIMRDRSGKPVFTSDPHPQGILRNSPPTLAIDLSEHAYFSDYSFDKRRYLAAMLPRLDLSEIFSGENSKIYLDTPI